MPVRSIRARLTLWYTCLSTVLILLLGGAAYGLLSYSLYRQVDDSLTSVARTLSEQSQRGAGAYVPSEIDEAFRRFFGFSPLDRYFRMLDPRGRRDPRRSEPRSEQLPLGEEALRNAAQGVATFETVEGLEKYPVRILTAPVMEGGRLVNLIQVGTSLQNVLETLVRFLIVMAVLLPAGLALAVSGGLMLARRALKPVDRMIEAARHIGAEHLAERVQETGAGDELDRLSKTLNEMLERLDAAFRQIRQFSADASHELQTPLTILKGELEVGLRASRSPEEYREILGSSLEEVDRIDRLVDGLLMLHRAEAGVLRMDRREVPLDRLLEDVARQLKVLADDRAIELILDAAEPVAVQGDFERLRRMLLNLAENAVKYTGPGGRVRLSLKREGDRATIAVSDTGLGIPEEERERIFEPFYRAQDARSMAERGTGLGLSIARSIAAAHGGSIRVESEPGRGSTFTVLLECRPQIKKEILSADEEKNIIRR